MAAAILSQKALKEILHYCPETGEFTWLVSTGPRAQAGSVAGSLNKISGYQQIKIQGKLYRAHRLAWLYTFGEFPPEGLDHKNRDRADNRIGNLRLATQAENQQNKSMHKNNTSGHVGVYWDKSAQKWQAKIRTNYKTLNLGRFTNIEDAIAARKAAEKTYHQFQNQNETHHHPPPLQNPANSQPASPENQIRSSEVWALRLCFSSGRVVHA